MRHASAGSGASSDPAPLFTPAFVLLGVCELAYFLAAGLTIPITPLFAEGPLGADELWVGITVGAFSVTALVLRPLAGRAADRRGRRWLLISGALLCAAVLAATSVTTSLAMMIALRLLLGVAEAFFFVAGFAALADLAPPGRTGEALSFNSLALYLGIALGPALGEWLLDLGGFTVAWLGGAGLAVAAAALAVLLPETGARDSVDTGPMRVVHPAAIGPGLVLCAGIVAMGGFLGFAALHARDLGMGSSGPVLLAFGLAVVGCRIFFAKLPDRMPPFRLGSVALALTALGLAGAALFGSVPGLLVSAVVMGIGVAFITPAMFSAVVSRVRPTERGAALGTASVFIDIGFGGGPVLVGFVAGFASISAGFGVAAGVAAVGAIGAALAMRPRYSSLTGGAG
jgi:MFS family permease